VNLLGLYHSFKTRVPGFDRVTGLVFFKKSKRRRFSKKKKSQRVCNRVLPGQPPPGQPGNTGFFLSLFFLQPGPVPAPGRPGPGSSHRAGPAGFQNYRLYRWFVQLRFYQERAQLQY